MVEAILLFVEQTSEPQIEEGERTVKQFSPCLVDRTQMAFFAGNDHECCVSLRNTGQRIYCPTAASGRPPKGGKLLRTGEEEAQEAGSSVGMDP